MDQTWMRSLEWRNIGPHRAGRVVAVAGHPTERATFYFGGCAGGVWKTTSSGALWENISDGWFQTAAVGAIAVAESDPNVIYVGMGEATIRSNVSHGDGVYRSGDGGATWRNVGLAETRHIGDLIIHPRNADIVYVAALGHAWGQNAERGVYRTRDGGATWERVLFKSTGAGAVDLAMDPHNPEILFATIWQTQRSPHGMSSGGEDCGLWRSTDGGTTWQDLSRAPGMPKGMLGKIGVAVSPAQAGRVWALVECGDQGEDAGGLFRSEDWGATWQKINADSGLRQRPWYYMHVYADPQDAESLWVLNVQCYRSHDGGKSFLTIPTPHGDNHDLWIDPRDPHRMIQGNDGGAIVSLDDARTWSTVLNQPTAQFYHVIADDNIPYRVYGSQQDNWAMRLPSIDFDGAISWKDYVEPGGGESGYIAISRQAPHRVFGGGIGTGLGDTRLLAWDPSTGQKRNVSVWPDDLGLGMAAADMRYRTQWTFPVEASPHDANVIYACSNYVHRTTDDGSTWAVISPDLTRNDPSRMGPSGGPITADNSGAEVYCTIFAFRESPVQAGVFWAGSDDGLVHVSRDGGGNWERVTPDMLPEWAMISIIEPSPFDAATAYVVATRYKLDDTRPYVYKTTDFGATWSAIVGGLPLETITRVVRADPVRPGLLYLGTETGVFLSFDDGATWDPLVSNLPVVPIHDLFIKGSDLLAATHGRSFWILDDLTPLRAMPSELGDTAVVLLAPRPMTRFRVYGRFIAPPPAGYVGYRITGPVTVAYRTTEDASGRPAEQLLNAGKNPPDGVIFHYLLGAEPAGEVTLTLADPYGTIIRTYSSTSAEPPRVPARAGANRFLWNLRYAPPMRLEDPEKKEWTYQDRFAEEALAPRAIPGTYEARLRVGDITLTQTVTILADPRLAASIEDLQAQFAMKLAIRDQIHRIHQTVQMIRQVRRQTEQCEERAGADAAALRAAGVTLREQLQAVEDALINRNNGKIQPGLTKLKERLAALSSMIDESDDRPTAAAQELFTILVDGVQAQIDRWDALRSGAINEYNNLARSSAVPALLAE